MKKKTVERKEKDGTREKQTVEKNEADGSRSRFSSFTGSKTKVYCLVFTVYRFLGDQCPDIKRRSRFILPHKVSEVDKVREKSIYLFDNNS